MKLLNMVSVNQQSSGTLPAAATNKHACPSTNRQFGNCVLINCDYSFVLFEKVLLE